MTKHFNCWLTGTGWAEIFFSSDKQNIKVEFSYLSDPLADLFEGLCRIMNNQSDTEKIVFVEEPGQHSLIISKFEKEKIKIEIFWSDEWENISEAYRTEPRKQLIYSDIDTPKNFMVAICAGMDSPLKRHTLAEYKEKWSLFEFPIDKYKQLQQLLI